jgi:hypothetical protein
MMMMMMMIIIIIINKIITDRNNKRRQNKKYEGTVNNRPYYISMPKTGKEHYIEAHNTERERERVCVCVCVCAQMHSNICTEIAVKSDNYHRYKHVPKLVETSEVTTL